MFARQDHPTACAGSSHCAHLTLPTAPGFPKLTSHGESRAAVIKPAPANPQIRGSDGLAGPLEQDPSPSL